MKRRRRAIRRKNPQLVTLLANPNGATRAQVAAAIAASKRFHGVAPKKLRTVQGSGPPLVALGDMQAIEYRPTRGHRRGPAFRHKFGRGAVLAATADGKELVVIPANGKPFRVDWERGIVG